MCRIATAVLLLKDPDALSLPSSEGLNVASSMLESEKADGERERLPRRPTVRGSGVESIQARGNCKVREPHWETNRRWQAGSTSSSCDCWSRELRLLCHEVVTSMIGLQKADMGSLQLYDAEKGTLEVLAQNGSSTTCRKNLGIFLHQSGLE